MTELEMSLFSAVNSNDVQTVKELLKTDVNPDCLHPQNVTPLWLAAQEGYFEIVVLLIAAGANIHFQGLAGQSVLFIAAYAGHALIVSELIFRGASIELANNNGSTPLIGATSEGHADTVDVLIAAEVNVNTCDQTGATSLCVAHAHNYDFLSQKLQDAGATPDLSFGWLSKQFNRYLDLMNKLNPALYKINIVGI